MRKYRPLVKWSLNRYVSYLTFLPKSLIVYINLIHFLLSYIKLPYFLFRSINLPNFLLSLINMPHSLLFYTLWRDAFESNIKNKKPVIASNSISSSCPILKKTHKNPNNYSLAPFFWSTLYFCSSSALRSATVFIHLPLAN